MFPNNDFDRNFKRAATGFGLWWLFSALLGLGVFAALAFVAWHFIAKVW